MKPDVKGPRNIGFFDLMRYRFPCTAIASILHRLSGVLLFVLIPALLCLFERSLISEESFHHVLELLSELPARFFLWLGLSALLYHTLAGIKHLLMDVGCFESLQGGKYASLLNIVVSVLGAVALGVWLW